MEYNNIYKQNQDVWSKEPNKLLQMVWAKVATASYFLDLGCGQGRDSLFMAKQGFKVVAVDESSEAVEQLRARALKENLNIEVISKKIEDYKIEKNKFSIINAINIFQFLKKKTALNIIKEIKHNIKIGGFIIIAGFTTEDPGFITNKDNGYFRPNELSKIFKEFDTIFYKELIVEDPGHAGAEHHHEHGVARLIAKKI